VSAWPLAGIAVVVLGFALRLNAVLVVVAAAVVTGLAAGMAPLELLAAIGTGFRDNRFLALFLLTLPVLGALERNGLREHAAGWIAARRRFTLERLLIGYLALRQASAALGLTSLGGQAQTVRPLLAPMAEGAAESADPGLSGSARHALRAMAAATDNVGLFFGEDIFVAFGAVLLIAGVYAQQGIRLEPLEIALWGIPTAVCAFLIHAWRLRRFARRMQADAEQPR
jgi:uncharacterized membrane protein